jgi:protein-disulfide isomerase
VPQIEKEYIKTGKVKYVFRDFPIESIHPQAFKAHEAANCAGEQGKYWEMHDRLFSNPKALGEKELQSYASALDLDLQSFDQCLNSGKNAAEIRKDTAEGVKAGVRGTPTFLLGLTEQDPSKVKVTMIIRGAQPYSRFKQMRSMPNS